MGRMTSEEIQVAKCRKVNTVPTPGPVDTPPLPDFLGQMKETLGDRVLTVTGAQIISEDRDG
jgi:hypothetical protein